MPHQRTKGPLKKADFSPERPVLSPKRRRSLPKGQKLLQKDKYPFRVRNGTRNGLRLRRPLWRDAAEQDGSAGLTEVSSSRHTFPGRRNTRSRSSPGECCDQGRLGSGQPAPRLCMGRGEPWVSGSGRDDDRPVRGGPGLGARPLSGPPAAPALSAVSPATDRGPEEERRPAPAAYPHRARPGRADVGGPGGPAYFRGRIRGLQLRLSTRPLGARRRAQGL